MNRRICFEVDGRKETDHTGGRNVFTTIDRVTTSASYFGELHKSGKMWPYAVAARIRVEYVPSLPFMCIDVGQLESLLFEVLDYVQDFVKAEVPVGSHLWGCTSCGSYLCADFLIRPSRAG